MNYLFQHGSVMGFAEPETCHQKWNVTKGSLKGSQLEMDILKLTIICDLAAAIFAVLPVLLSAL